MCRVTITQQGCGCEGYNELRVAFGSLSNCQLKCPFCFTLEQQPSLSKLSLLSDHNLGEVKIIRFTGGEPFLTQQQVDGIVRELRAIESLHLNNLDLVIIQTNAILSESVSIGKLFDFGLPILFEVSLKGTNVREYQFLTHSAPINQDKANTIMIRQLQGYEIISNKCASIKNMSVLVNFSQNLEIQN